MASRKPLTVLAKNLGELPVGDDLLLYANGSAGARFSNGNTAVAHLMDATNYYLLLTPAGQPLAGAYTAARPFSVNLSTGQVSLGAGLSVTGSASLDYLSLGGNMFQGAATSAQNTVRLTGQGTDAKNYDTIYSANVIQHRFVNDANTAAATWLQAIRSGYAASSVAVTANAISLNGATRIGTNPNAPAAAGAAFLGDTVLQVAAPDGTAARLTLDSFGGATSFSVRRANGAAAAPAALAADDLIGQIAAFGYAATGYASGGRASVSVWAGGAWTDASQPTYLTLGTTPAGGTSQVQRLRVQPSGNVTVGTSADDGVNLLQVAGPAAVADINVAGSGNLAGAWSSYQATVSASTGAITTASATVRWKKLGRTVFFNLHAQVTNNGSGAGALSVSLPFANNASSPLMLLTRDLNSLNVVSGYIGASATTIAINRVSDNAYPIAANGAAGFAFSGTYEASA